MIINNINYKTMNKINYPTNLTEKQYKIIENIETFARQNY
jgi:hypothetical protein